ncbi:MAG: UTP--glucose-1-phosphate uridylyltransferase GalU [Gammaproteobacteria bacterium]
MSVPGKGLNNCVKKAVFPVAGIGTRFLPATKAVPKEMLPIIDKPLIQYAVDEAIASGVTEIIFVTNSSKVAIEQHFVSDPQLEKILAAQNKQESLDEIKNILPKNITCVFVQQQEALGLGHAVLCAKEVVGDQPFAVLLPDDLIYAKKQVCLQQLIDVYQQTNSSVVAVQQIQLEDSKKYGVVDVHDALNPAAKIYGIVEKPEPLDAPSNFGVVGRYILKPQIFNLLEQVSPGSGSEIQLTDGIAALMQNEDVYACKFDGTRYDCGTKIGFLHATVEYALRRADLADDFRKILGDQF